MSNDISPIACDMTVMDSEERERHEQVGTRAFHAVQAVEELEDGYAFRFRPDSQLIADLGRFMAYERLCCPFFDFSLEVAREQGPVTLRIVGRDGVKAFLQAELVARLDVSPV